MASRNFDTNTERTPTFFDSTTFFYGWKNSEANPDKDFKVTYNNLFSALRGGFTAGSVIFAGAGGTLSQDNSNLFWDDTLNRLGIGTTSPTGALTVFDATFRQLFDVQTTGIFANRRSDILANERVLWWNRNTSTAASVSVFFGFGAGNSSTGGSNVGVGGNALTLATSAENVAVGANALAALVSGSQSVAIGSGSLQTSTGSDNTAVGRRAGFGLTTGSSNVHIGWGAGSSSNNATISNNVIIGRNADISGAFDYCIVLGSGANASAANQFMAGGSALGGAILEAVFGGADVSGATPHTTTIRTLEALSGTSNLSVYNVRNLRIAGARGTGTGNGGNVDFSVAPAGASGSAKNAYLRTFQVVGDGAGVRIFQNATPLVPNSAPAETIPADCFAFYSNDVAGAGTASPHFRTEAGDILKLYRETTAVAAAVFVSNTSNIANDTATFDGYTIGQVVKALRNFGLLA